MNYEQAFWEEYEKSEKSKVPQTWGIISPTEIFIIYDDGVEFLGVFSDMVD